MRQIEGMKKFVKIRSGRKPKKYLTISPCGQATLSDGLVNDLELSKYKSVDFFSREDDLTVAVSFYESADSGELKLRARAKKPVPISCGFGLHRFVKHNPKFIGTYQIFRVDEMVSASETVEKTAFFVKTDVK